MLLTVSALSSLLATNNNNAAVMLFFMNARQLIEIHPRLPLGFIHGSLDCVSDFSTFILVFLFDIFTVVSVRWGR